MHNQSIALTGDAPNGGEVNDRNANLLIYNRETLDISNMKGHMVLSLVEALCYEAEGCSFDSQ
jgi:hypothetical protein